MTFSPLRPSSSKSCFLGIEGGATRSTGVLLDADENPLCELHGPPANIKLISERQLADVLRAFADRVPSVPLAGIGVGFAGVRTPADRERVRSCVARIWPGVPCVATNDLETALETAISLPDASARVLVLAGTGSCCFGVNAQGVAATVGGRGHVVGDRGSACDISQQALRAIMAELDHTGKWPLLGQEILRMLCLNDVEELIAWSLQADKTAIAGLATAVFAAASRGDRLAKRLLRSAALALAADAGACASKLAPPGTRIQFVLNGGVLLKNPGFSRAVSRELRRRWPGCRITPVSRASCWGAALLAKTRLAGGALPAHAQKKKPSARKTTAATTPLLRIPGLEVLEDSPTEKRNPRSRHLDRMPLESAIALMLTEESGVAKALLSHCAEIAWAVRGILRAFRKGGRLFYVGAGTSGRLGILDASECPPTFRSPGEQVQALIAGGAPAIISAVEGAEDDTGAGERAVASRGIRAGDFVVGIAASGRTPFVWAALAQAAQRGATTLLVCFNPALRKIRRANDAFWPHKIIAADVGPEVLTGSTRLKCGTATKLLLNVFSTLSLARSGKVLENLMIDVNPSNAKLRERAVRILMQLENCPIETARETLEKFHWSIPSASKALRRGAKTKRTGQP